VQNEFRCPEVLRRLPREHRPVIHRTRFAKNVGVVFEVRQYGLDTEYDSESENGKKGSEASILDERGHSYAQDPRAREKENDRDRAHAEA
jgi:hypothetical protein